MPYSESKRGTYIQGYIYRSQDISIVQYVYFYNMCIYPSLLDDSFQSKSKAQKGKDKKKQTMKTSQEGKQGVGVHIDTCLMYYKKTEGEKKNYSFIPRA